MQDSDPSDQKTPPHKTPSTPSILINEWKQGLLTMVAPAAQKLNGKGANIKAGAGMAIVLLIIAIIASYFLSVRVPDNEYAKVLTVVQAMSDHAKNMAVYDRQFNDKTTSIGMDEKQIATAKAEADKYVNLLLQLQNSPVVKKDSEVKAAYDRNRKIIDEYGTSSVSLLDTVAIYSTATRQCSDVSKRVNEPKTLAQFDELAAGCKSYVTKHKTVQMKKFNDEVYVKYRKAALDFVAAARKYYVASNSKNGSRSSMQRAMTNMDKTQVAMQKVGAGADQYLKNSPNSSDQLSMLREVIEERQEVWLR